MSSHLNRVRALDAGLSARTAAQYSRHLEVFRLHGSTPLLTLRHLTEAAGISYGFARHVISRTAAPYTEQRIPKSTGGYRTLLVPIDPLKEIQRWLLDNVLHTTPRHPNSFAYHKGVPMREAAERHIGSRWMIKSDLHNFFPSIDESRVTRVFKRMGYPPLLAFEMARLCTWPQRITPANANGFSYPYATLEQGLLPQGAPTSGAIANSVMGPTDDTLTEYALQSSMAYTRYSDDLVFSSSGDFSRKEASAHIRHIEAIVARSGLMLHRKKTRLIPPGARKIVLGLLVTDTNVRLRPEHRRRIDIYIHNVATCDLASYALNRKFDSVLSFIAHVYGWLSYAHGVDPDWTFVRMQRWEAALNRQGIIPSSLK